MAFPYPDIFKRHSYSQTHLLEINSNQIVRLNEELSNVVEMAEGQN